MKAIERSESGKLDVHKVVFSMRMLASSDAIIFEIKNGGRKRSSLDFVVGQTKDWTDRDLSSSNGVAF